MNCYYHPNSESVVLCKTCGVGMCRECESSAYLRTIDGFGQALCKRCSITELQAMVKYDSFWLKKRLVKLILSGFFIAISFFGVAYRTIGIPFTVFCFIIAGAILSFGVNKYEGVSEKTQVYDAINEYNHPIMTMILKIIGFAITAPVMFVVFIVGYIRRKINFKNNKEILGNLEAEI